MEARSWQPVPCEILSSRVASHQDDDSVTHSVEALYRYEIDGREHRSSRYQFMGGSTGTKRLQGLRLWLECSRTTTVTTVHERGASVRSSTDVIDTIEILRRESGQPLSSGSVSFTLPEGAQPTSRGDDESISWKLKLQGEIAYWPDVAEEYEVSVRPASG